MRALSRRRITALLVAIGQYITVLPQLDLVIAHKTRPGGGSVSWGQYTELVDRLIAARCRV
jgi:hypothetical protein